jgi:hypothetical protein
VQKIKSFFSKHHRFKQIVDGIILTLRIMAMLFFGLVVYLFVFEATEKKWGIAIVSLSVAFLFSPFSTILYELIGKKINFKFSNYHQSLALVALIFVWMVLVVDNKESSSPQISEITATPQVTSKPSPTPKPTPVPISDEEKAAIKNIFLSNQRRGEDLVNLEIKNKKIEAVIDLADVETRGDTKCKEVLAETRFSEITSDLLSQATMSALWSEVKIRFGDLGQISRQQKDSKTEIVNDISIKFFESNYGLSDYCLAKETEEKAIANALTINFVDLFREPEVHSGEIYKFTGEIIQISKASGSIEVWRLGTKQSYTHYYDNVIMVQVDTSETDKKYLKGDVVTLKAKSKGNTSYTTVMGAENELPLVEALPTTIELLRHLD